jgi:hypothetical protein
MLVVHLKKLEKVSLKNHHPTPNKPERTPTIALKKVFQ